MGVILLVGPSATGKSTWARNRVRIDANNGTRTIIVSRDKYREMLIGDKAFAYWEPWFYNQRRDMEDFITHLVKDAVNYALSNFNVILDNTHLRWNYIEPFVNDITEVVVMNTAMSDAILRDWHRKEDGKSVGRDVIEKQFVEFNRLKQEPNFIKLLEKCKNKIQD